LKKKVVDEKVHICVPVALSPHMEHMLVSMLGVEAEADASPPASPVANCGPLLMPAVFRLVTEPLPEPLSEVLERECELSAGDADRPGPDPSTEPEVAASVDGTVESPYARLHVLVVVGGSRSVGDEACDEETEIGVQVDTEYWP
jgi:hypothetical protein